MRTVRQPTLKTWLTAIAIFSLLCIALIPERVFEGGIYHGTPSDRVAILFVSLGAMVSWLAPLMLSLLIRSSSKVAVICAVLHVLALVVMYVLRANAETLFTFLGVELFLDINLTLAGTMSICEWAVDFLPYKYMTTPWYYAINAVSAIPYGLVCYWIAKTYRLRETSSSA